jgi:hypothetical protein
VTGEYYGAPAHLRTSPSTAAQSRCDDILSDYRANPAAAPAFPAPPTPPAPPPATDDLLLLRLAEELEYARRMMDAMGDALCADPAVVMRHSVSLQSVDIVGQMLGHIANVVRSSRREDSVELIGMCELKSRLTRRSLG